MNSRMKRAPHWLIFPLGLILTLTGCLTQPTEPPPSPTDSPAPTASPIPTATIDWFPASPTPEETLIPQATPTPEFFPALGALLLTDDFSDPSVWALPTGTLASAALDLNQLTIVLNDPRAYLAATRTDLYLTDYYLEVTARTSLCAGLDEYGVLLRAASPADFYRFSLSCDGQFRLDRIRGGTASSPVAWTFSSAVPQNPPASVKIGVWVTGDEMHLYLNDQYQLTANTPLIPGGTIGFFARSAGENAVTVNFSGLTVWEVLP